MCFEKISGLIKSFTNIDTLIVWGIILFFVICIIKYFIILSNIIKDKGLFMDVSPKKRPKKKLILSCKVMKSKTCFFVKSFLHYILCRNILLNIILFLLIIVLTKNCLDDRLLGPLFGALLTLNIVNYFNYYIHQSNINYIKKCVFADLIDFMRHYTAEYLTDNYFPVHTKNRDEHKQIRLDSPNNLAFLNSNKEFNDLLDRFKEYFDKIRYSDLYLDNKQMEKYLTFFSDHKYKIYENINTATILIPENCKIIKMLTEMKNKYNVQIEIGQRTLDGPINFENYLNNVIGFIKKLKEVNNYISDVWY